MEPEVIKDAEAVEVVIPTEEVIVIEEAVAEEMATAPSDGVVHENVCTACEG